jgi:hypothetical protein
MFRLDPGRVPLELAENAVSIIRRTVHVRRHST